MPEFDYVLALVLALLMLLDVVLGVYHAWATSTLSSSVMREGLGHKFAYVGYVALAYLLQVAALHVDLGFDPPLVSAVCGALICVESLSIVENLSKINPELSIHLFDGLKAGDD